MAPQEQKSHKSRHGAATAMHLRSHASNSYVLDTAALEIALVGSGLTKRLDGFVLHGLGQNPHAAQGLLHLEFAWAENVLERDAVHLSLNDLAAHNAPHDISDFLAKTRA